MLWEGLQAGIGTRRNHRIVVLEFAVALAAFLAAHVIPAATNLRARATAAIGRRNYLLVYSLLSTGLLLWVIWSAQRAPYVELWPPAAWRLAVPVLTMPIALALLGAAAARPNALSISILRSSGPPRIAGALAITRHPILWAFLLWSLSHVIANGDVVAAVLFGSLSVFSVAGMIALDRRARKRLGEETWRTAAARTSLLPFAAILQRRASWDMGPADVLGAVAGLAAYAAMMGGGHEWLFGVAPAWP